MPIHIVDKGLYVDSVNPPLSPRRGMVWTERSSNGDILQQWFWNGTYWLSSNLILSSINSHANSLCDLSATGTGNSPPFLSFYNDNKFNLFVEAISVVGKVSTIHDASNYWSLLFCRTPLVGGTGSLGITKNTFTDFGWSNGNFWHSARTSINLFIDNPDSNQAFYDFRFISTKVGTPGNLQINTALVQWRSARK